MATDNKSTKSKKGKQRYLPYNKAVKKKGAYPLHPGVEGFFITCDGGRERQASQEAINVIDSFYEELVSGKDSGLNLSEAPSKPSNKKIVFSYSDSSSSEVDDDDAEKKQEGGDEKKQEGDEKKQEGEDKKQGGEDKEAEEEGEVGEESKGDSRSDGASHNNATSEKSEHQKKNDTCEENKTGENTDDKKEDNLSKEICANEAEEPPAKKQCLGTDSSECTIPYKVEDKSIDKLIEAELQELGDKNKRRFFTLESGCNGVVFVQMRKREGDPSPNTIVQHMMTSAAATKKHMSRFILRVLPVEVACYSSEEEISRAIKPLLEQHFPVETKNPQKFAVLYEARANTGIDRMKIINAVAKSVPAPHKVDLSNPDKTIVVEICRTICLIGVVDKYKQLAKYNLRQLTSSKP